ncbi:MAG: YgjV family protein [Acutalibacteraceae bacterium]
MTFLRDLRVGADPYRFIAQLIGFVGMSLMVFSFQQKSRKGILVAQMVGEAFWVVHYGMLGAYTGMALNILGVIRCYVYSQRETKKWANHTAVPIIFFIASIITGILSWTGPASLLPMAAVCITSFVLWSKKPNIVRAFSYPGCTFWLIFNLINRSYAGVLTELFNLASITVGIIRLDIGKNKKRTPADSVAD